MSQHTIHNILNNIESELRQLRLWSATAPDAAAFNSTIPFCYDTMALEQWLQFILLPRFRAMLDAGVALPVKISILPVAEEAFKAHGVLAYPLLQHIALLDKTLSAA
ncbi:YqcC family protein [Chromatiaceae bacterium AAb-1]|nr:YqcC family protein [Chromatiaceae bacterium AAb-1]